jgi:hypothetical protein
MKTYWDLTKRERGTLSAEKVARFERIELMQAGVLEPEPLVLEPSPSVPAPDLVVYKVAGSYPSTIAEPFRTIEEAHRFMESRPVPVASSWKGGAYILYETEPHQLNLTEERIYSRACWLVHQSAITEASNVLERNRQREVEHEKAMTVRAESLQRLRADLEECREWCAKIARILRTRDEYAALPDTTTDDLVRVFLVKAFGEEAVAEALAEWKGQVAP